MGNITTDTVHQELALDFENLFDEVPVLLKVRAKFVTVLLEELSGGVLYVLLPYSAQI